MKLKFTFLVIALFVSFINSDAQNNCITSGEVKQAWTNIPYFDGDNARITLNEKNANSYNCAKQWLQGSFSIDMWMKTAWLQSETHDNVYVFFSAGHWNNSYNSLFVYFEEYSTNQWRIRISDGTSGNADLYYNIDYVNNYQMKWNHLALTYDDYTMRLYINGQKVKEGSFTFNDITDWHCTIGHNDDSGSDFRGDISGIRIWKGKKLTDSEIGFIWDKTFNGELSMPADKQYLYQYLVINMFTDVDNIYSLIPNKSMIEEGIVRKTDNFHAGRPVNAYNLNAEEDYQEIRLNWERGTNYSSFYIYRRQDNQTGDGELLCITNDSVYIDNDNDLTGNTNYVYTIKTFWKNPNDPLAENGGLYTNNMPLQITAALKEFDVVQNLRIDEDATSGNCSGEVRLIWDELFPTPTSYKLEMSIENGEWQVLNSAINNTQYFHSVNNADLGKNIRYRVDANGDKFGNYSSIVTGIGNEPCADPPTSVSSSIYNNNIKVDWAYTQTGAPASAFKIYRKADAGSFDLLIQNIDAVSRTYTDETAQMCIDYQYKVEAYNTCGGASSSATSGLIIPIDFDSIFTYREYSAGTVKSKFDASKGYYNQKVRLEWLVNPSKKGDIDFFEIYRRLPGNSYDLLATINNSNATTYDDMSTEANTIYEYMIRAIGDCSGVNHISDSLEEIGFRYSTAIVAGKITYAGGNGVPDVEVRVSTQEDITATSLYFDGNGKYARCDDVLDDSLYYHAFSTDCWIKPNFMMSGEINTILSVSMGTYLVGIKNMKPVVALYDRWNYCSGQNALLYIEGDTTLEESQWYHIATNFNPQTGEIELYLNGNLLSATTYNNSQVPWWTPQAGCSQTANQSLIILGRSDFMNHNFYSGYIDELRIWQSFRTPDEIKRDYVRILNGTEPNLIGYYRFDENYAYAAYDLSKSNTFNQNDFDVTTNDQPYFPEWSPQIPSFEQLHPSGITDANGNYTIRGVRYSANGNIFTVAPFLGIHEFNPSEINLFIGDAASVHNNVDFIDQSAFRFTGTAYYAGTNVPVENADIYIDNVQQFDGGGHAIQTNVYGQIDISVPIGEHYISLKKQGHTFAGNGQWPIPSADYEYPTHNFQDNVYNITFWDSTKVSLVGRFVGGDVEGNKKLDLGLSKANIGQGTIVLKNEQGYDINPDETISNSRLQLTTDNQSGEYRIDLLPIVYKIDSVGNDYYQMNNLDLGLLDLSDIPDEMITVIDTASDGSISQTSYHFERKFIYFSEPTLSLTMPDGNPLIGESEYIVENPSSGEKDTIDLLNNSPFRYPIFNMGKTYPVKISVKAVYYNHDNADVITDTVAISDAQVNINNNIEITEPTHQFTTNEDGIVEEYVEFRVGLPNMNADEPNLQSYTKTINLTATAGNYNISWNNGEAYRAYVLGGVDAEGVNYVTYGPELTYFVLRDPPGDKSYTILEQGSSYSASRDFDFGIGSTSVYDNVLMRGVKFAAGGGLAGPVFETEVQTDINLGISTTSWVNRSGEFMETFDFNQTFSTSSESNAVGSMADVYIGKSVNLFFTETNNLRIFPKSYCDTSGYDYLGDSELINPSLDYTIGKKPGFAVTEDPSSTMFVYSQDHILNSLLPSYRQMIFTLLTTPKYTSHLSSNHLFYGMDNNSPIWKDSTHLGDEPSYHFNGEQGEVDSVAFLNQQIGIWLQTIALNEASKLEGNNDVLENISFDGNAGAYSNTIEKHTSQYTHKNYFYRFEAFGGSTSGFSINGTGLVTYSQTYKDFDLNIGSGSNEERYMKWTYVLDDSQQGDYYSVDVKQNSLGTFSDGEASFLNSNNYGSMGAVGWLTGISGAGSFIGSYSLSKLINPLAGQAVGLTNAIITTAAYMGTMGYYANQTSDKMVSYGLYGASPVFSIQGGQSRCPYEGPEYTAFYIDSAQNVPFTLHAGTQQHEIPKISISPSTVINVPDGSPAVFTLSLTNESATGADLTFELMVDQNTNPDGAELRIDGISPDRSIFIPAGTTITKTLTVERGPNAQMDYDNLRMILHSSCQYNPDDNFPDIADSVSFSAHFIPSCTYVGFNNIDDDWVLNSANHNILPIQVGGYNINQPTFEKVYFQYQQAGATPTTYMTLFNDTTGYSAFNGNKMIIGNESAVNFDFDVSALNDGIYSLKLISICCDGSTFESDIKTGVIDRVNPQPFGTPEPTDGILSFGEDISVQFNETIQSGELYTLGQYGSQSYIQVRGITNGTDLVDQLHLWHDVSVNFDGLDDKITIPSINLSQSDFTIEFWAKRSILGGQTVLSLGQGSQGGLWIGYDNQNRFSVQSNGQVFQTAEAITQLNTWAFYGISYQAPANGQDAQITLFVLDGATGNPQSSVLNLYGSLDGPLYVAYSPEGIPSFNGNLHELRIWNYARLSTEMAADKAKLLSGRELGLYGLWKMDEAHGLFVHDLAFGRTGNLEATWQVSRDGKSVATDVSHLIQIPAGSMVFDQQSDFTIEFWYKMATPYSEVCLMSNGDYTHDGNINAWSIVVTPEQKIKIEHQDRIFEFDASSYLDNDWHHMALSLNRLGYLTVYMDAQVVSTQYPSTYAGFGASKVVFGSKWYQLSQQEYFSLFSNAVFDEIRIWNSARTDELIQRYMHHALNGDEPGLKAYFPFEDVTIEDPSISNASPNNFTQDTIGIAGNISDTLQYGNASPNIKLHRPELLLPHTLVINDDQVVINPNINDNLIENQILEVSIKRVKDMNNNVMSSTLTWNALVDRNHVIWQNELLTLNKVVGVDTSINMIIQNRSGLPENWHIDNIPSWLEVMPSQGSLNPNSTATVSLRFKPEMNVGSYNQDIHLISSMAYNERLNLDITVIGHIPNWEVIPSQFNLNAYLIGQLQINNVISTDENDIVGCFVGNECRGMAQVEYFENSGIYLVLMNLYANQNGETLNFKVYDASTGDIYSNISPTLTFAANQIYGSIAEPIVINASNQLEQNLNLSKGWNWISFNVFNEQFASINEALMATNADYRDLIKSQSQYAIYSQNNQWVGSLKSLDNRLGYKVKLNHPQTWTLSGYKVLKDTLQIPLVQGWNWISYPLAVQAPVNEALASIQAQDGDLMVSQHSFVIFSNTLGWVGSLEYLQPNEAYMIKVAQNGILNYTSVITRKNSNQTLKSEALPQTETNMNLILKLDLENADNYSLKAYAGENLVGYANNAAMIQGESLRFLTINAEPNQMMRFVAESQNDCIQADELVSFESYALLGSINQPMVLHFNESLSNQDMDDKYGFVSVYPNPFETKLQIILTSTVSGTADITLSDMLGRTIVNIPDMPVLKGEQVITLSENNAWDKNLESGFYTLRVKIGDSEELFKIMKK